MAQTSSHYVATLVRHGRAMGLDVDAMLAAENLGELYRAGQRIFSFLPPPTAGLEFSLDQETATVQYSCCQGERDPDHNWWR